MIRVTETSVSCFTLLSSQQTETDCCARPAVFLARRLISGGRNQISLSPTEVKSDGGSISWFLLISSFPPVCLFIHRSLCDSLSLRLSREKNDIMCMCKSVDLLLCYSTTVDTSVSCFFLLSPCLSAVTRCTPCIFLCLSSMVHRRRFCHSL